MLKVFLKGDLIISVVVFFGAVFLFFETYKFEGLAAYGELGPAYWPRFLLIWMMVLGVTIAVGTVRKARKNLSAPGLKIKLDNGKLRLIMAAGLIVSYLGLMTTVGFLTLTPLLMMAFMRLLGERSTGWIIGISFGMTIVIVLIFTKAMYVPLPRGTGVFLSISRLIY